MEAAVDEALCTGHGRCYDLGAPVFTADDDGFCAERGTAFAVVPAHLAAARAGAASCPQLAITLRKISR
jgi:ferredoxin